MKIFNKLFLFIFFSFPLVAFAQKSPHGNMKMECSDCHSSESWNVIPAVTKFNHASTGFMLEGKHQIADCKSCHQSLVFSNAKNDCFSCHNDPHRNTLGVQCVTCHNTQSWQPVDMMQKHNQFRFALVGVHQIQECKSCHTNAVNFMFTGASVQCFSCHKKDYKAALNPMHEVMQLSTNCEECHTVNSNHWTAEKFHHSVLSLAGVHKNLQCNQCHNVVNKGLSQECVSCHKQNFDVAPNHLAQSYPTNCLMCHNSVLWSQSTFNHATTTFQLIGSHTTVQCASCHTNGFAGGTPTQCVSCHQAKFNTAPNHLTQGYPTTCETCHNSTAWNQTTFNHSTTSFPLIGSHTTVQCASCHTSGLAGTPTQCFACHQSNFVSAANHVSQGYPTTCETCHNSTAWNQTTFNHSTTTFPLTGSHTTVQCANCHTSGFAGTPTQCYACHQSNFVSAVNHVSQGYPTTCETCHNSTAWNQTTFNHSTTTFPLTGSHTTVQCASCHTNGFAGTPTQCYACHQANFVAAANHVSQGYPTTCETCHNSVAWNQSTFNHAATTFPLVGSHTTVQCASCHANGFAGTPTQCYACHQANFVAAANHVAQGYPTTCETCHNSVAWNQSTFNHANTNFPLTGSHVVVTCNLCHTSGFAGTSKQCFACHGADFRRAQNPDHVMAGISHSCETCHNTTSFIPSSFDHATTGFPLTGVHASRQCTSCHNETTSGASALCYSCHANKYATAPNHVSQGYPKTCETCHSSTAWNQSTFNHANTNFPLTGAHTTTTCMLCHAGGFAGTTTVCYDCHITAFQNTTNPNHISLSIPTNCTQCHTTAPTWKPATFPIHNTFFQLVGAHTSQQCTACHQGNYSSAPTACYGCHQSDFTSALSPPHQTNNFSHQCLTCHQSSQNSWSPASFNHSFYPVSSHHNNVACTSCHSQASYGPQCVSCHASDYRRGHRSTGHPNCWTCHNASNFGNPFNKIKAE